MQYGALWKRLGKNTQLPLGLTDLRLPRAVMPAMLCQMVENLTFLTRLDCQWTDYYPSLNLSSLQVYHLGPKMTPVYNTTVLMQTIEYINIATKRALHRLLGVSPYVLLLLFSQV
jgi:hypothetical protein